MVKLKKPGPSMHGTLQNAVVMTINDPSYSFSLPRLTDWDSIVSSSADEKQRLEFIGDAVMHLSVALYLYDLFPDAAPGLYTNIRSAVNANATFTHLMAKAGAYKLPSQSHSTKAAADSFEVIVAALYLQRGFAEVCSWVQEQYAPLITAARKSYDSLTAAVRHNNPVLSTKRQRGPLDTASTPLLKKIRLSSGRSSPRSTLMAQRVINRMKSKGKVKLCFPIKKSKPPLEMRLHSCKLGTPEPQKPSSVVIDLTMDGESDDEAASLNVPQVSLSNFESPSVSRQWLNLSQSDAAPRSDQNSHQSIVSHWHLEQGTTALPRLSLESNSTLASSAATPLAREAFNVPQATFEFFRRSGLSLPPQSDNMHIPSGSYGNPIVIDDDSD